METIPFAVVDQMIQCFGKCFYYKDTLESFLVSAGVKREIVIKYKDEAKYVWGRKLLLELLESESGILDARKILNALFNLRKLPDSNVTDKQAGLDALRILKELINEYKYKVEQDDTLSLTRQQLAEEKSRIVQERLGRLDALKKKFYDGLIADNRQQTGFDLEDIIRDLFGLFEIEYSKSYKTSTQQIDGCFNYANFHYLVEAKWRKDSPTESEIGGFQRKVNTKLESTRGLFVSVAGFRDEVAAQFNGHNNIIMMCGMDLTNILEGRIDLKELLNEKITKAAQHGVAYYPSSKFLSK